MDFRCLARNRRQPFQGALSARYNWLKNRWFGGPEFYLDATAMEGRRDTVGLQCLRGQCAGVGVGVGK